MTTTTSFIGDIKFKDGDTERLASELATVEEVNTALKDCVSKQSHETAITNLNASIAQHVGGINSSIDSKLQGYYTKDECDNKYVAKTDDVDIDLSSYYTKDECDNKYATSTSVNSLSSTVSTLEGLPQMYCYPGMVNQDTAGLDMMNYVVRTMKKEQGIAIGQSTSPMAGYMYVRPSNCRDFVVRCHKQAPYGMSIMFNSEGGTDQQFESSTWHAVQFKDEAVNTSSITATNTSTTSQQLLKALQPNIADLQHAEMVIGKSTNDYEFIRIGYMHGTNKCGYISSANTTMQLSFDANGITFGSNSIFTKDVEVKGKLKTNGSKTITHYAPIEEDVTNYTIGKPVFMSGKVYKRIDDKWIPSTSEDTEDCISSVLSSGTYKTYVGIITRIDEATKSITFATHGDYLFTVDDSAKYSIGDTVCYDGSVVLDSTIPTVQIQSSIIGKVSSIVDGTHIAVFKY